MSDFGFNWVYLLETDEQNVFRYERLLYYHQIPFHTDIDELKRCVISTPQKFMAIAYEIIEDYNMGKLVEPVNQFNPRYSNFERGKKVRYYVSRKVSYKWQAIALIFLFLFMFGVKILL